MSLSKKEINDYVKEVEAHLLCSKSIKKKILFDLKNDVSEYIESNHIADMEIVFAHFGKPDEIAKGFVDGVNNKSLNKATKWKKQLFIIGITIISMIVIYLIASFIDGHREATGFQTPETVIENNTTEYLEVI